MTLINIAPRPVRLSSHSSLSLRAHPSESKTKFKIMVTKAFEIGQLILAVLVIVSILLQQQGSGLGAAFGGEGNFYRSKRGLEKILFYATIVLIVLFVASVAIPLFLA